MDAGPLAGGRSQTGWIAFAGVYLLVAGTMNAIWGFAALTDREVLRERALAWSNLTTWGWLSPWSPPRSSSSPAALVLARRVVGRLLAIVIALAGLFVNFLSIGAYPVWSILAPGRERPRPLGGHRVRRRVRMSQLVAGRRFEEGHRTRPAGGPRSRRRARAGTARRRPPSGSPRRCRCRCPPPRRSPRNEDRPHGDEEDPEADPAVPHLVSPLAANWSAAAYRTSSTDPPP